MASVGEFAQGFCRHGVSFEKPQIRIRGNIARMIGYGVQHSHFFLVARPGVTRCGWSKPGAGAGDLWRCASYFFGGGGVGGFPGIVSSKCLHLSTDVSLQTCTSVYAHACRSADVPHTSRMRCASHSRPLSSVTVPHSGQRTSPTP